MGDGAHPGIAGPKRGPLTVGVLVTVSLDALVAFCVASELAAIPLILIVRRRTRPATPSSPAGQP